MGDESTERPVPPLAGVGLVQQGPLALVDSGVYTGRWEVIARARARLGDPGSERHGPTRLAALWEGILGNPPIELVYRSKLGALSEKRFRDKASQQAVDPHRARAERAGMQWIALAMAAWIVNQLPPASDVLTDLAAELDRHREDGAALRAIAERWTANRTAADWSEAFLDLMAPLLPAGHVLDPGPAPISEAGVGALPPVRAFRCPAVVGHLPRSLHDHFVGRRETVRRLDARLAPTDRRPGELAATRVSVEGPGGFGKSQLAAEYVLRFHGSLRFPGGVFWMDASVTRDSRLAYLEPQWHAILCTLQPETPSLDELRQQGRNVFEVLGAAFEGRAYRGASLVVLDGVPEPRPGEEPLELSALCPGLPWVSVLVTSRRLVTDVDYRIRLGALTAEPARALLTRGIGMDTLSAAQWDEVTAWMGRLPLVLELVGRALEAYVIRPEQLHQRARGDGQVALSEELLRDMTGIVPVGALRGLVDTLDVTYDRLSADARAAARTCALVAPSPVSDGWLQAVCAPVGGPSTQALLHTRSLLAEVVGGGFRMHAVLADHIRHRACDDRQGDIDRAVAGFTARLEVELTGASEALQLVPALGLLAERAPLLGRRQAAQIVGLAERLYEATERLGHPAPFQVVEQLCGAACRDLESAPEVERRARLAMGRGLHKLGELVGEANRFEYAMAEFDRALALTDRGIRSLEWARVQYERGASLEQLGARKSNADTLRRAQHTLEKALEHQPADRVPLDRGRTLNNLGMTLTELGAMVNDETLSERAIETLREAVSMLAERGVPLEWASAMNNLGRVLDDLGLQRNDTALLEAAVEVHRQTLEVRTPELTPIGWVTSMNNLALGLQRLGARRGDEDALVESVDAYHAILEAFGQGRGPFYWGTFQNGLGAALQDLATLRRDPELLAAAMDAYELSLTVRSRTGDPVLWGVTQNNMGRVFETSGTMRPYRPHLIEAQRCYELALEEITSVRHGVYHAIIVANLERVRRALAR